MIAAIFGPSRDLGAAEPIFQFLILAFWVMAFVALVHESAPLRIVFGILWYAILSSFFIVKMFFKIAFWIARIGSRESKKRRSKDFIEEETFYENCSDNRIINSQSDYKEYAKNLLGLEDVFSMQELKDAYRREIKKYHPDRVYGLGEEFITLAAERTMLLKEAYDYLVVEQSEK